MITQMRKTVFTMIEIIKTLPEHVLGVRATGEVTKEDLETVLIPAMDKLVERTGAIHYLLVLDNDVSNWDFGAWVSDAKLGLKYFTKWHKIAVVTEQEGVRLFTKGFSAVVPGESRAYTHAQLQEATDWVVEYDAKDVVTS